MHHRHQQLLAFGCSTAPINNVKLLAFGNLKVAVAAVVENVVPSGFATSNESVGADQVDSVYVLAQCRKDKSSADCATYIKVATKQIGVCPNNITGARASYDGCFLRYENYKYYISSYTDEGNKQICGNANVTMSNSSSATAQRIPAKNSIERDSCEECLSTAKTNINKCFPRSQGRAIDAGCYLRYDSKPFFPSNATIDLEPFLHTGKKKVSSTVWVIIGVVGGVFILGLITCLLVFRKRITRTGQKQVDTEEEATELQGPGDFDFEILKKATNNFDQANKLGEGGFGEVFKGTLKNGKDVAVKKLILGQSARAVSEFEREVKLISNVHHKNLVRLLGCCRQGQERLLVYEYMPNSSLDRKLFGEQRNPLSWKERFKIILGTARGLAYLHEEFHVRIIHRDIKSSNILLDQNFEAKLADFGLARLLPNDKSHVSTKLTGTLGYTAP
ncbi:hypothetical protein SUGI_1102290 [Cryptomeria japonica]|nr:hypothetical protein SUGI_1102290 [Cryptomeria japonica]